MSADPVPGGQFSTAEEMRMLPPVEHPPLDMTYPSVEEDCMSDWSRFPWWQLGVSTVVVGRVYWEPGKYTAVPTGGFGGQHTQGPTVPPPQLPAFVSVWAKQVFVSGWVTMPLDVRDVLRREIAAAQSGSQKRRRR